MPMKLEYLQLRDNQSLPVINHLYPFRCVVIVEETVSPQWQYEVSRWLVNSGCFYMLAWGIDAESWDDAVDYASIETDNFDEFSSESLVMTTWHANDSLPEVLAFCKHHATHQFKHLENTLLLHVANENLSEVILQSYKNS